MKGLVVGYFLIYKIKLCLKNKLEWINRLFFFKCMKFLGYMCFLNEDIIEFFEFCYKYF